MFIDAITILLSAPHFWQVNFLCEDPFIIEGLKTMKRPIISSVIG